MNRRLCTVTLFGILVAAILPATTHAAEAPASLPAGTYTLDKAHSTLLLKVSHLGFSHFTARFATFDAELQFEPRQPAASNVGVVVEAASLQADNGPAGFLDGLRGRNWLDSATYPKITFRSTRVAGPLDAMEITGDFTLHGVTRPITLMAVFNGGYAGHPKEPRARIGFSAKGQFKRSEFGITAGLPPPGSLMGVGDLVDVVIEAEFNGPALAVPAASAPAR